MKTVPVPVHTFTHFGIDYVIVRTASYDWRSRIGYKPKQPYLLCRGKDCSVINGVSEDDLAWYQRERPSNV